MYLWRLPKISPKWNCNIWWSTLDDIDGEEDNVDEVAEENDENVEPMTDIDPALVPVPEGFNDDEEVLV